MKLREFKFNDIPVRGLSIFVGEKEVANGFIGEVLRKIPHLADYEIKNTNIYFDEFVIRLEKNSNIDGVNLTKEGIQEAEIELDRIFNEEFGEGKQCNK